MIAGRALTGRSARAKRSLMRPLINLLIGLALFLALGTGAFAHAMEPPCNPAVEAGVTLDHSDDATDQRGDGGKVLAHQHGGCHGHHVAAPVAYGDETTHRMEQADPVGAESRPIVGALAEAELRPPIA